MLLPASTNCPPPLFVKPPKPERELAKVTLFAPTSTKAIVPAPIDAKRGLQSMDTPGPNWRVPPENVSVPLAPRARGVFTRRIPAPKVVPPE